MVMRKKSSPKGNARYPWLDVPTPVLRSLQVYAIDPSEGKYSGNLVTVHVPWEPLLPGPTGRKVAVIDYDAANKCYYPPVQLDDPMLLASEGLDPSESDPRFHQQMVYAIACRTIHMFEVALGREIHWRRADRYGGPTTNDHALRKTDDIRILKLYPHAMQEPGPQPPRPARIHLSIPGHHRARGDARSHRRHPRLLHGADQSRRAGIP
jgi:hypothetical protein